MEAPEGKTILIVDDDRRNIFALQAVLKSRGFECITASSPIEGLQRISDEKGIGAILLDMMMPEMDGYVMIPLIRAKTTHHIPVIAVTAQAMVGDREKCMEAGADDYISKPIDVDNLLAILTQALS